MCNSTLGDLLESEAVDKANLWQIKRNSGEWRTQEDGKCCAFSLSNRLILHNFYFAVEQYCVAIGLSLRRRNGGQGWR